MINCFSHIMLAPMGEQGTHRCSGEGTAMATVAGSNGEKPVAYKKGAWSKEEDEKLIKAVEEYGARNWVTIEKYSGLARPAKNCRLRWMNYLRPNLKKCPFTPEEESLIRQLHAEYGNSWSRIAAKLPGRSDNEIKNFWHKRAKKSHKHQLTVYPPSIHSRANVDALPPMNRAPHLALSQGQSPLSQSPDQTPPLLPHASNPPTSSEAAVLIPNTVVAAHMQTYPPSWQGSSVPSDGFAPLGEPPILSSLQGCLKRLSGANDQLSPTGHQYSVSGSGNSAANASAFMQLPQFPGVPMYPSMSNTTTGSRPLSPAQLKPSSSYQDLPAVQRMSINTDDTIPTDSSPGSIQFNPPDGSAPELESKDKKLMKELMEAKVRVRFLKKRLKMRRLIQCSTKDKDDTIHMSEKTHLQDVQKLRKIDSKDSQHVTRGCENSGKKTFQGGDSPMQHSTNCPEQGHPIGLFDHINSQNNVTAPDSDCWATKPYPFQFPKACSTTGCLFGQCCTPLQDYLLERDMLEYPWLLQRHDLVDAFGPVYGHSTATVQEKPGNESNQITYLEPDGGGNFSDNGFMNANLLKTSTACESKLLQQQYHPPANMQEPGLDGLLINNLWPGTPMISHDRTLVTNTSDSGVDPITISQMIESEYHNEAMNCSGHERAHEQEQGPATVLPEELSSLPEFIPTAMQAMDWSNDCKAVP